MLFEGGEFGIVDRHQPGQPDPRLVVMSEIKALGGFDDRFGRRAAGFEGVEIEHRLDFDETMQLLRLRRFPIGQRAPGEMRRTTGQHLVDRIAGHRHRRRQSIEAVSTVGDPHQPYRQRVEAASEARIGGQRADQRCRPLHAGGDPRHLLGRHEQQAVLGEEPSALRLIDGAEMRRVGGKRLGELGGGLFNRLRGRRVDDSEDAVLRECLHELKGALGPGQLGREQLVDVGFDREMPRRVDRGESRQPDGQDDHRPGMARAQRDEANDR